jgi:hypothetical protein
MAIQRLTRADGSTYSVHDSFVDGDGDLKTAQMEQMQLTGYMTKVTAWTKYEKNEDNAPKKYSVKNYSPTENSPTEYSDELVTVMPAKGVSIPDKLAQQQAIPINFSRMVVKNIYVENEEPKVDTCPVSDQELCKELKAVKSSLLANKKKTRVVFHGKLDPNFEAAQVFLDIARDKRGLLTDASYQETDFSGVDLSEGDFRDGQFFEVNLERATVRGANFSGAEMQSANFREVDGRPTDEDKITYLFSPMILWYGLILNNSGCC